MRRMLVFVGAVAVFAVPAAARADLLTTYQEIAARRLSPAPLVPTTLPRTLSPARRTVGPAPTRKPNRSYAVRVVHYSGSGPDAVILVTGGELKTLRATLRDYRTLGFASKRRTRVRGHRGWLLTHRGERALAWVERGVVYTVGSGTPKKVSLTQLRATARGLDRLERDWLGTTSNPDSSSEATRGTAPSRARSPRARSRCRCTRRARSRARPATPASRP
jgi:hypothetical protein